MCCGWKVIVQSLQSAKFGRENRLISHFWSNKYNCYRENSLSGFIHLISSNSLQKIYWICVVESTNSMSQEIGHVTLSHGMSLVITLSRDCASPFKYTVVSFKRHKDLPQIPQWWKNNTLFFPGTRTPDTLISPRKYSQSKYISTNNSGSRHEIYISTNNSGSWHEKYILGGVTHWKDILCDIGNRNIFL